MTDLRIEAVDHLPSDIARRVEQGQTAYEKHHDVVCAYTPLHLMARDAAGEVIGVLQGYTAYDDVYVDDLWVDAAHRRQGIGRKLLGALEAQVSDGGFTNISLVTNAFQAVDFYRKCGFEVEFIREHPSEPKLTKTFFINWLKP